MRAVIVREHFKGCLIAWWDRPISRLLCVCIVCSKYIVCMCACVRVVHVRVCVYTYIYTCAHLYI